MRLQRITNYLLTHRWQTVVLTFAITFIPVIGTLGILIAALVTLRKSILEGAMLAIAATLPYAMVFFLPGRLEPSAALVTWATMGVAIASNFFTWVTAVMLRKQATFSTIFQVSALVGVLIVSVIHLINPNVADWWGQALQAYYQEVQTATGVFKTPEAQIEAINTTKEYATGLMTAAILFSALIQLIAARWWQATVFSPGSLRRELCHIRLSPLAGVLFVISLVLSYLGNSVVLDIMPILYLLFCAAGLSVVHYLFGLMHSPTRWFWVLLLYLTLIFSWPVSVMVISLIALLDIGLDVRKRVVNKV
ncbi:MAG: hypothetical protein EPO11_03425 [Gammaproteobacteria bacterium]|nr:MAG: hypothetical protein EPO11_03425 [Gammaproteobacteria bacterium]